MIPCFRAESSPNAARRDCTPKTSFWCQITCSEPPLAVFRELVSCFQADRLTSSANPSSSCSPARSRSFYPTKRREKTGDGGKRGFWKSSFPVAQVKGRLSLCCCYQRKPGAESVRVSPSQSRLNRLLLPSASAPPAA